MITISNQQQNSDRYQFGVKWGWKKYNQKHDQDEMKSNYQDRFSMANESGKEAIEVVTSDVKPAVKDDASLRILLTQLFNNRDEDVAFLNNLKVCDVDTVSLCVSVCFRWVDEQLQNDKLKLPSWLKPEICETGFPNDFSQFDIYIFLCLFDRYVESLNYPLPEDGWWSIVGGHGFPPFKMLFTMSALVAAVVHEAVPLDLEDLPLALEVAKCGVRCVNEIGWDDRQRAVAFCKVFESIVNDHAYYGNAMGVVVERYINHKWPKLARQEIGDDTQLVADGDSAFWPGLTDMDTDDLKYCTEQPQFQDSLY
ncbi:hypothetical protein F5Y08DRAFT_31824 [Xylaria arbuscula]|nr:hypothetical protein F5Y08DRAFT_31824 [Xylaria arbuscula]